jgi:hypothetical protein
MKRKIVLEEPTPHEVSPEADARFTKMIEQADRDVDQMRANSRERRGHVDIVKRDAATYGMPYQT